MVSNKIKKLKKIFVGPSSFAEFDNYPLEILKKNNFQIINNPFKRKIIDKEFKEILGKDVIGTIAGLESYNENTLNDSSVKVISRVGSGIDNIDFDYINKNNIKLFRTEDGPTDSVAELTISMMINLVRQSFVVVNDMKRRVWKRQTGHEIKNKNIVIIGYGKIGQKVSEILSTFCNKIHIVDPYIKSKKFNNITFEESLEIGEIFTIHTNSKNTFFNIDDLKKVKNNIYILNSSRGHNLDEESISYGIQNNLIHGVWIDVFNDEPYKTGKYFNNDKIILTPHTASFTVESRIKMEVDAVLNLVEYLNEA